MAIQSLKKQNFRKCWHNREKLPNKYFLKISFAVSDNIPTFAVRWSGSLREVPSVAPAYSNNAMVFVETAFLSICFICGGCTTKVEPPVPFLSLAFARCFCSLFLFRHSLRSYSRHCTCALILVQLLL